jgi:DNA-directed RNA polymerase
MTHDQREQTEKELLLELQEELEGEARELGGERYRSRVAKANVKGRGSTVGAGATLRANATAFLQPAIQYIIDEERLPSQGRRSSWEHGVVTTIKKFGKEPGTANTIAHITARTVIDDLLDSKRSHRKGQIALDVATYIVDELKFRRFRETHRRLFDDRLKKLKSTDHYGHQQKAMNATMAFAGFETPDLDMNPLEKSNVGEVLIDLLLDMNSAEAWRKAEGLANVITGYEGKRVYKKLVPTDTTLSLLANRNSAREFDLPRKMPMVVPPLPWSRDEDGGYLFNLFGLFPLVKHASPEHLREIKRTASSDVFKALNLIQATPWRINREVLDLVEKIRGTGRKMAGIVAFDEEPEPPKPNDIDENKEARKKWRSAAHDVYEREHERKPRAAGDKRVLDVASRVASEIIYFPYNLDFTGRLYPIADSLSPEGGDFQRALLLFADARLLGPRGSYWLAIHGANCLGKTPEGGKVSKMTFAERIDYIERHTERICRVVTEPFEDEWWAEGDEPLQFFAFCCEWKRYLESGRSESFVSGLPIYQDGSCNGLQHFSALLRDEVGGAAVNLVPGDGPRDIYHDLAEKVKDKLEERAEFDPLALMWLDSKLVDRDLTKKPTMTFAYGSRKWGQGEQIREYLEKHDDWKKIKALFTGGDDKSKGMGAAVGLMSELIWNSLRETVVKAGECMDWLRDVAREIAKGTKGKKGRPGKCVTWTVPVTNFRVRQEYFHYDDSERGYTAFRGIPSRPRIYRATDEIDTDRQADGMAPNYIHSLDAAALMITVARTSQEGISSFGVVHDNFATVAGDYHVLARETRRSFVQLHRGQPSESEEADRLDEQVMNDLEVATEAGVDLPALWREFSRDGELSRESTEHIQKAGFDRAVVDRYIAGRQRDGRSHQTPLAALDRQLREQMAPGVCEKPPKLGDLDLDLVLNSPYFFA